MKTITKAARIWWLKKRLRAAYLDYREGASYLDCGQDMSEHISPKVARAKTRCNSILAELSKLDPDNCPCARID